MKGKEYHMGTIKEYIQVIDPDTIRSSVIVFLVLVDVVTWIITYIGGVGILSKLILIPIAIINLWGVIIFIDTYRWQKQFILFMGSQALALTILVFILQYQMTLFLVKINGWLPLIFVIAVPSVLFLYAFNYVRKYVRNGVLTDEKREEDRKNVGKLVYAWLAIFLMVGVLLDISEYYPDVGVLQALLILMLFNCMSVTLIIALYKYYLMCKFEEYVIVHSRSDIYE